MELPATGSLRGMIRQTAGYVVPSAAITFVTDDGTEVALRGPTAELLANARGMSLWVSGEFMSPTELFVHSWRFLDWERP
jgi:hypothetical protein